MACVFDCVTSATRTLAYRRERQRRASNAGERIAALVRSSAGIADA